LWSASAVLLDSSGNADQFLYQPFENDWAFSCGAVERGIDGNSSLLVSLVCPGSHEQIIAEKNGESN
jgi:hypothetical protein